MQLIDTHAHMYLPQFEEDLRACVERARALGVTQVLLPNIDHSSIPQMHALQKAYPDWVKPMIGLHPCSVSERVEEELQLVRTELEKGGYIAVGEIGIDLYWDKTYIEQQKQAFRTQVKWAKEVDLPIAIHARDSFDEIYEILLEENTDALTGVFHCFTGSREQAQQVIDLAGFKLGIGGVVTFKNAGLDRVVRDVGLEHLVLETDAPYLAPVPYRGKRNESSYVRLVAEKIAALHQVSLEEVAAQTSQNAQQLFRLA